MPKRAPVRGGNEALGPADLGGWRAGLTGIWATVGAARMPGCGLGAMAGGTGRAAERPSLEAVMPAAGRSRLGEAGLRAWTVFRATLTRDAIRVVGLFFLAALDF